MQFTVNGWGIGAKSCRRKSKKIQQSMDCPQTFFRLEPLRLRKMDSPFRISSSLIEKQRHGIAVRGEKLQERRYTKLLSEALERVFIARQGLAVDEDVVTWIFTFDHDVEARAHRFESN